MLTGDQNIIKVAFSVQWQISDAEKFLFNIRDRIRTIHSVGGIGDARDHRPDAVRKSQHQRPRPNRPAAHRAHPADARQYGAGVPITQVALQHGRTAAAGRRRLPGRQPPKPGAQTAANQAQAYFNRWNAWRGRGQAHRSARSLQGREGRAALPARRSASSAVYEQYRKSPDITERRLYLETMERDHGRPGQGADRQQAPAGPCHTCR